MAWSQRRDAPWAIGRDCGSCGTPLFGRAARDRERKRFCSYACAGRASAITRDRSIIPLREISCGICGSVFRSNSTRARFCSVHCSKKSTMRRYNARRATLEGHLIRLRARPSRSQLSQDYLLSLYAKQEGKCALSGVQMTWVVGQGQVSTNLSIDRIEAKGGYVEGNVRLICREVNLMRRDLPTVEFLKWCCLVAGEA